MSYLDSFDAVVGYVFSKQFTVKFTGMNFAGLVVKAEVRDSPGGTLKATLDVTNLDVATVGQAKFTVSAATEVTSDLTPGDLLFCEICLTIPDTWGPYSADRFNIAVKQHITEP